MTIKEPSIASDYTQPIANPATPPPPRPSGPRNVAIVGVMVAFALVAVVMLGLGFVAGRASTSDDSSSNAPIIVAPPNADAVRQTEAANYTNLVTQNARLSEQVALSQQSFATADARLREIAPLWETAAPTINAVAATSAAPTATPDDTAPIVTLAPNTNTPIQGLLPGETGIATDENPYPYNVSVGPFIVADTLPRCGRIEGSIAPALLDRDADFRVEWRHTSTASPTTVLTRGGANGPGVFSIGVTEELLNGVFIIQVYDSADTLIAPVVTIRFPRECTGYSLQLDYAESLG